MRLIRKSTLLPVKTYTSCSDIYVQDVTVTGGATLTLDAADEVIIGSNFEVRLGSELEIK